MKDSRVNQCRVMLEKLTDEVIAKYTARVKKEKSGWNCTFDLNSDQGCARSIAIKSNAEEPERGKRRPPPLGSAWEKHAKLLDKADDDNESASAEASSDKAWRAIPLTWPQPSSTSATVARPPDAAAGTSGDTADDEDVENWQVSSRKAREEILSLWRQRLPSAVVSVVHPPDAAAGTSRGTADGEDIENWQDTELDITLEENPEGQKSSQEFQTVNASNAERGNVKCPYCMRWFNSAEALGRHLQKHPVRQFCAICESFYEEEKEFEEHCLIHEEMPIFRIFCVTCERPFASEEAFMKHQPIKSDFRLILYIPELEFSCMECWECFESHARFMVHNCGNLCTPWNGVASSSPN